MCQTFGQVEPPAHRRSAGKPHHKKLSPRPGLVPTRWRAEGFQVSDSNRSATGAPTHISILLLLTTSPFECTMVKELPRQCGM